MAPGGVFRSSWLPRVPLRRRLKDRLPRNKQCPPSTNTIAPATLTYQMYGPSPVVSLCVSLPFTKYCVSEDGVSAQSTAPLINPATPRRTWSNLFGVAPLGPGADNLRPVSKAPSIQPTPPPTGTTTTLSMVSRNRSEESFWSTPSISPSPDSYSRSLL